ncbi:hypothetical protein TNIN_263681 [Trichonephila inaurata madagascariensis]|uniref:Uncharacterized protein n=1 Tax=Trichonephila inaurata madagascariensis TaxID=2747483 RepID=A0A8X6Y1P8_9ARAC|nr:hypothetical protein TNIN_263681 [Trichonephila inaurata madagascariensis]
MQNEKNSLKAFQKEPSHRSVPRTEKPLTSKRRRGRLRKRSLSDSNRSEDSNEPSGSSSLLDENTWRIVPSRMPVFGVSYTNVKKTLKSSSTETKKKIEIKECTESPTCIKMKGIAKSSSNSPSQI